MSDRAARDEPGLPPVVLIGPMGSGKTRVGKRVARLLGVGFTDTDTLVVAEHGPIATIFDTHGEPHFRALERSAAARALASGAVVALGGGAILDAGTRALLEALPVVYLTVTAESVAPRLGGGTRPLVRDGIESWQRILDERRPLYESLATVTIDTSHRGDDAIAEEVARWARNR